MASPEPANPYAAPQATSETGPPQRVSYVRYLVLAALCLAALIAYVQRNSIGVAEAQMREDLTLSKQEMGYAMSAFFLTYALLQLPTGWIAKVLGTRRALAAFTFLFSAAAGALALAGGLPMLLTTRLGMGAFQAGIFPASVNTIGKWLPSTQRSSANGMLAGFMSVGAALGSTITGLLLPLVDWRWIFALYSVPGFLFAAWFVLWFRERPDEHPGVSDAELRRIRELDASAAVVRKPSQDEGIEPTPWGAILLSVPILALCAQQVFRAAGYMFFGSWFPTFLRETRGVSDAEAGLLTSLPLLAVVVGSPVGGILSDVIVARTGSRRAGLQGLAIACMIACSVLVVCSYVMPSALLAVLAISAGSFFAAFAGPIAYTATIEMGGRHVPMVFSLMNMMGNVGAFVFPLVVPMILRSGSGSGAAGGNWGLVLFMFAGIYLVAAAFWLLADTRKVPGLG